MKTKLTTRQIKTRIEACRKRIIKERDQLRDLIQEATALEEDADDAQSALGDTIKGLDEAADYLSRNS